ncbi:hypothetical protein ACHAXR_010395 [Thalassiosira sp. AJA248-18]
MGGYEWLAESVAANEGAGGIDIYDLFTNTKSDIGTNPHRVDDHALEEYASLPDHKTPSGVRGHARPEAIRFSVACDRSVARNKEKLRREVVQAMKQRTSGSGRGNRVDLIVAADEEINATLIEEEMASLVTKLEGMEEDEKELLKILAEEEWKKQEQEEKDKAAALLNGEDKPTEPPKKKKKKSKDKEKAKEAAAAEESSENFPAKVVDPRLLEVQKAKLTTLLHIQSLSLQLPPLRDNADNLLRYLRSDTATNKVVCEYVGWKLVRNKLKELQKKGIGTGGGGSGRSGGGGAL